ncbi:c-type cytochrome [bacterium]|nr:c-type cytochrome [bacterium]
MKEQDKLLDSNYDGIEEFDNDLPRWWLYLFYFTMLWSVAYVAWYHLLPGNTTADQLQSAMRELEQVQAKNAATQQAGSLDENGLVKLAGSEQTKAKGKEIYALRCAACHGQNGEGLVGPNLTDPYWIHGGKLTEIRNVIETGVLDKGMLAWKGVLPNSDIDLIAAYVWTLQGTNPANPKAPQGDLLQ